MRLLSACPVKSIVRDLTNLYQRRSIRFKFLLKYQTFYGACLIVFLLSLFPRVSFAHGDYQFPKISEGQTTEALGKIVPLRFLPSHPLFFLISIKESITRFFKPSVVKRAEFDMVLSGKRLKEATLSLKTSDLKKASRSLKRYQERLISLDKQLVKAQSQNQDVVPLVSKMADDLQVHETLIFVIANGWETKEDAYDFDENLSKSISAFSQIVEKIDSIKPGLGGRFKISTNE